MFLFLSGISLYCPMLLRWIHLAPSVLLPICPDNNKPKDFQGDEKERGAYNIQARFWYLIRHHWRHRFRCSRLVTFVCRRFSAERERERTRERNGITTCKMNRCLYHETHLSLIWRAPKSPKVGDSSTRRIVYCLVKHLFFWRLIYTKLLMAKGKKHAEALTQCEKSLGTSMQVNGSLLALLNRVYLLFFTGGIQLKPDTYWEAAAATETRMECGVWASSSCCCFSFFSPSLSPRFYSRRVCYIQLSGPAESLRPFACHCDGEEVKNHSTAFEPSFFFFSSIKQLNIFSIILSCTFFSSLFGFFLSPSFLHFLLDASFLPAPTLSFRTIAYISLWHTTCYNEDCAGLHLPSNVSWFD